MGEVFYDSLDCCLPSVDCESGNMLWSNPILTSVDERRKAFLWNMGFIDSDSSDSGAGSSSCDSPSSANADGNGTVEYPDLRDRDDSGDMASEPELSMVFGVGAGDNVSNDPQTLGLDKKGKRRWWEKLTLMCSATKGSNSCSVSSRVNKKRFKELSALYTAQEFRAHKGVVWTAKFSPGGRYLATGGGDGVVRVWRITSAHSPTGRHKPTFPVPVFVPDRVFQIEETPLHELQGHRGDVLDLAWSNSDLILSSSTDNTVRLWQVGSDECLGVFRHPDFVTCVEFNPVNDGYLVTGSVDGKIRVWGVSEGRVTGWDDAREAVTAVSYQPDGQGLVAGLLNGTCRFYEASGSTIELSAQVQAPGGKRSSGSRISGIQFCHDNPERVIVTSEDSKIRVFDQTSLIKKYRGLPKSGTQTSASLTPSGRHIVSVGEDSRVYLWDYNSEDTPKHPRSTNSCEYFHSQGASVALPWGGHEPAHRLCTHPSCSQEPLPKWPSRVTATWPEEMLPVVSPRRDCRCDGPQSPTWGLVIVTATCDGMIRVFHNYGLLPIRV